MSKVSKTEKILSSLKDIADPQIAFQLQRYCASTCLVSHLLRCTPLGLLKPSVSKLNMITRGGFADIHGIPLAHLHLEKFSWTQATLPIRHGGLGLIPASRIADAAYVGSVQTLLSYLVPSPRPSMTSILTLQETSWKNP